MQILTLPLHLQTEFYSGKGHRVILKGPTLTTTFELGKAFLPAVYLHEYISSTNPNHSSVTRILV